MLAEQPQDIIDFSIKYFGKRATEQPQQPIGDYTPNTKDVQQIYQAIKDVPSN